MITRYIPVAGIAIMAFLAFTPILQSQTPPPVPVIDQSGRIEWVLEEHLDPVKNQGAKWKDPALPMPSIPPEATSGCDTLVIYVSGFQNDAEGMKENSAKFAQEAAAKGFTGQVVGYIWDSNPGGNNFDKAKASADLNAKVLAFTISEINKQCPDQRVVVVTHSLGARVALGAMMCGTACFDCVMTSPAVDDESVQPGEELGPPMPDRYTGVGGQGGDGDNLGAPWGAEGDTFPEVKNWYNPHDRVLKGPYRAEELDNPLGLGGIQDREKMPDNYKECSAYAKLFIDEVEKDHGGYILSPWFIKCVVPFLNGVSSSE